ncbi:SH3 domain-containing protein [Reichenbachiella carrageenanivorans]|uniref:SH3 domain-containing protein n=1 Tax=Reichenbachiella carrageenanivorans TaxID=2979869 RepID=A0ABY6D4N8_9BACT|nr:SH3 domain-containing protein [Reichenbachiella carrageenanivorans]UXX78815.1 SH3 domain-containing protein [Reichenbachiella carrageenanivorans]
MSKKQNNIFNFITILFVSFLMTPFFSFGGEIEGKLARADSLFKLQKYTESFEIYDELMTEQNEASPQMLMKMAYIKEGLGDYSQALIYLNKYYLQTSDKRAQNKMQELADEHELFGFSLTDTTRFKGLANKYYLAFNILLFSVVLFLIIVVLYRKFKSGSNAKPYAISAVVVLLAFFWLSNFGLNDSQAIIVKDHAYLMTGPSAGADLVEVVKKGHRLMIINDEGIWVKVLWNGQDAYIRSSMIKQIN